MKLTKPQRKALHKVWLRIVIKNDDDLVLALNYRAFRRTVLPGPGCIMVRFADM